IKSKSCLQSALPSILLLYALKGMYTVRLLRGHCKHGSTPPRSTRVPPPYSEPTNFRKTWVVPLQTCLCHPRARWCFGRKPLGMWEEGEGRGKWEGVDFKIFTEVTESSGGSSPSKKYPLCRKPVPPPPPDAHSILHTSVAVT